MQEIVRSIFATGANAICLPNARTPGAAGAWNTALAELHGRRPGAFVALLDDDDAWHPSYLERCADVAERKQADLVVAGLLRRTGAGPDRLLSIPRGTPAIADFLVGNPHWQGSNTFARLDALLAAGGFDESFSSTNDRDLGIRLLDLPWLRWAFLDEHLVIHHAEPERSRLSSPGSKAKRRGLRSFFAKYRGRMNEEHEEAFRDRARTLFEVTTLTPPEASEVRNTLPSPRGAPVDRLMIGTISSPIAEITIGFLESLADLVERSPSTRFECVLLENSGAGAFPPTLVAALAELKAHPRVNLHTLPGEPRRLSIAEARTRLHRGCFKALCGRDLPVWLLDDDMRFDIPLDRGPRVERGVKPDYAGWIGDLERGGADVIIGEVVGEPPLPFASTMRVQLVDLFHNLEWLRGLAESVGHSSFLPSRHRENQALRRDHPDYYYDLSRQGTGHLERPFWYEPAAPDLSIGEAFREMTSRLSGLFAGRQVFRPIVWSPRDLADSLQPGFHCGPNVLVLRPEILTERSNSAPRLSGEDTRRSDMIRALLEHHAHGRRVLSAALPLRQDRSQVPSTPRLDLDKLARDIRGHATFRALATTLEDVSRAGCPVGAARLDFTSAQLDQLLERTESFLEDRLLARELSATRIAALARALELQIEGGQAGQPKPAFWLADPQFADARDTLRQFVQDLQQAFDDDPAELSRRARSFDRAELRNFFAELCSDTNLAAAAKKGGRHEPRS